MLKRLFLLAFIAASGSVTAAQELALEDMERHAQGDGSLIAMAQFCEIEVNEIRVLASRLEEQALTKFKGSPFQVDAQVYRSYAIPGIRRTLKTLAYMSRSGPGYESNCEEVRTKVSAASAK
jgi:hypothetical protein